MTRGPAARRASSCPRHQIFEVVREELFMPSQSGKPSAIDAEEAEEEQRLIDHCRSSFFCKQTELVKILIMLSGIKLLAEPMDSHQSFGDGQKWERKSPGLCNILQPVAVLPEYRTTDCRPGASMLGRRVIWAPKMGLFTALFVHYAFVKLVLLSILLLKRHLILGHLKSSLHAQIPRTSSCALSEDLQFEKSSDWAEFEQLKSLGSWLKFLGSGMVSLPELSVPSTFLIAILPLSYHYMLQMLMLLRRHRVDTLCFMLDPLGERRRLGAELRNIVRELILSQSNHKDNLYYGLENSKALHDGKLVLGLRSSLQSQASRAFNVTTKSPKLAATSHHETATAGCRRLLNDQTRRLRHLQGLVKIKHLNQVDPYIVSSKWHRILLRLVDLLKLVICFVFTLSAIMLLGAILYDLFNATRLRLEMVECTKWHPDGIRVVAFDHLYLDELKSVEQLDTYKAHDGSTLSFLKLALFVESTNYFSLRQTICWCEGLLCDYILGIEWIISASLHLVSTIDKIAWLYRLNRQIDHAANQAAEHAHLAHRFGPTQEDDERLLNTLTIVYLNYELFQRQHHVYLMLTDSITTCLALLSMMSCLIIYSSGVGLGNSSPFVVFALCSYLIATINLFLVASSYRLKQMEKIMAKVMRILAHCSTSSIQLSYPVELWRRQVASTFEESGQRYASRLFGVDITYETVIKLNAYAFGLLLILLKPQQSPLLH